jgi:hypothetical protein
MSTPAAERLDAIGKAHEAVLDGDRQWPLVDERSRSTIARVACAYFATLGIASATR